MLEAMLLYEVPNKYTYSRLRCGRDLKRVEVIGTRKRRESIICLLPNSKVYARTRLLWDNT